MASHTLTNGTPVKPSAASFWAQKRHADKTGRTYIALNVDFTNESLTNSKAQQKPTMAKITDPNHTPAASHKTTAQTLAKMKMISDSMAPAVSSPQNSMIFKRKQLARVFEDSDDSHVDNVQLSSAPTHLHPKDTRIQQLEFEMAAKEDCILALEVEVHTKDVHVQDLKIGVEKKDLLIQELVAQADKKTRHTAQLESELEAKIVLVQQLGDKVKALEGQFADFKVPISPPDQSKLGKQASNSRIYQAVTPEITWPKVTSPVTVNNDTALIQSPSKVAEPQDMARVESSPAVSSHNKTTTTLKPGTNTIRAPAPRDISAPVFVTPDTVKSVPPAPPAPVLSFPNKNLKKTHSPLKITMVAPAAANRTSEADPVKRAWSAAHYLPDIRNLNREQREILGHGPKTSIVVGDVSIQGIPKKMFMQVSTKAYDFFTKQPRATAISFDQGSMALRAVRELARWMTEVCTSSKEYSVRMRFPNLYADADEQNIAIMSAARVLGMSIYVRHFTRHYCDEIRKDTLSLNTMVLIEKFAQTKDPVLECLVNNLAHRFSKQNPPEQEELKMFLSTRPKLAASVEKTNEAIQEKRQASRKGGNGSAQLKSNGVSGSSTPYSTSS